MMRRIAIVRAPSVLGLRPTGVERLPEALLEAGLADRLGARAAGEVRPPPYDERRDAETGMLNSRGIAEYTLRLADAVGDVLDRGEFPVVLGGDCSILLGNLLALRRRGRFGLLFMDGHADFYQPEANVNGEAASSELALATGRGPEVLTRFDGCAPLVRDEDVAVLGPRDGEEAAEYGSQLLPPGMLAIDFAALRGLGAAAAVGAALQRLERPELEGFWIHFDADVLDDALMPAVDYRLPGGLGWAEARECLRAGLSSGHAVGLDVTIYNPALDPSGEIGRGLARPIGNAFGSLARG